MARKRTPKVCRGLSKAKRKVCIEQYEACSGTGATRDTCTLRGLGLMDYYRVQKGRTTSLKDAGLEPKKEPPKRVCVQRSRVARSRGKCVKWKTVPANEIKQEPRKPIMKCTAREDIPGKFTESGKPKTRCVKWVPTGEYEWGEPDTAKGGQKWTAFGSPLFTSTSKLKAPSWSMPAGPTCPAVRDEVEKAVINEVRRKKKRTNAEFAADLAKKVPHKCLACYAMGGRYRNVETQNAQMRRWEWFESTPDKEVEDTLVDAIEHAGREWCDQKTLKCTYLANETPRNFRLFDSGDFSSARDVKIWRNVMKRMPHVRFWAPTTAWGESCNPARAEDRKAMHAELKKMQKLPNVVVRPSAFTVDAPAPVLKGYGAGSAVVEPKDENGVEKPIIKKKDGDYVKVCDPTDKTKCVEHFVCPGDCMKCGYRCWGKKGPVAYMRHGSKPEEAHIDNILARFSGSTAKKKARDMSKSGSYRARWREVARLLGEYVTVNEGLGPLVKRGK